MMTDGVFALVSREEGKDIWPPIAYGITFSIVAMWALLLLLWLNRDETFYKEIEEQ